MAERLRSITRRIHWSSACRAAAFALAWSVSPYWLFAVLGLALYLVPFFEPRRMWLPFAATLALAAFIPHGFFAALFLGILCFLILGIKDFIFVDRGAAYEAVVLLVLIALAALLFSRAPGMGYGSALLAAGGGALAFFLLLKECIACDAPPETRDTPYAPRHALLVCGVSALILWQIAAATLLLPMNYFLQSALLIIAAAVVMELLRDHLAGRLGRKEIAVYGGVWLGATAAAFLANVWHV